LARSASAIREPAENAHDAAFIATASGLGSRALATPARRPRWASTTWARWSTSTEGMSIRTGHTSKQAPHSDEA
jgi:hypothetical protein